jgi:hypothetical protein
MAKTKSLIMPQAGPVRDPLGRLRGALTDQKIEDPYAAELTVRDLQERQQVCPA